MTHLDRGEIMKYLEVRDYQSILQFDEFTQQKNGVFNDKISEAKINFPPTFKYKKNKNVFSNSRNPSWYMYSNLGLIEYFIKKTLILK